MSNLQNRFTLLIASLAFFSFSVISQTTSGDLTGTIYDESGAVVPAAAVIAVNTATGVQSSTTASSTGQYMIPNLPIGTYDLSVTASGFRKAEVKAVTVELNRVATSNVTLHIGATTATVDVSSASAAIDTTTSQIQSTFSAKALQDLPITGQGAGVINLSLLSSGVSGSGSVGVGTGPSIGGQRPRNNSFMIEGVDNNDKGVTGPLVTVPNDAVGEFTLIQNQFQPEFGHSSGGQFNTVVRSGTNEFHGRLYEYLQNRNLNALDQQLAASGTLEQPRYDQNRLGGSFSGPIRRNKLFFFTNFEYNPVGQSTIPGVLYAPTTEGYSMLANIPGVKSNNLSVFKQYLGSAPSAASPSELPTGEPVRVGGIAIPTGLVPIVAPNYQNNYRGVASIDYDLSDRDKLRGRFIYNRLDQIDTAASLPAFYLLSPIRNYLANVTYFHNFSPTLTNEVRLGYNRHYQVIGAGDLTFPGLNAFPNLQVDELQVNVGPDPNAPQYTIINTYQWTDNLSWVKGAHALKFGYEGRKYISPQSFIQRQRGDYEWSTFERYLLDITPDSFGEKSVAVGSPVYYGDQIANYFYAQDSWKVRPNFTVNLGLRYEYTTVPFGQRNQKLISGFSVPGLINFKAPASQKTAFMPRVGFAYSPGTTGTTSIRGGFGLNYDVLIDNFGTNSQIFETLDVSGDAPNFLATGGLQPQPFDQSQISSYIPDQQLPYSLQWNFGVQHVFANNYTFEIRYLGTRGVHLPVQNRINVFSPVTPTHSLPTYLNAPTQAALNSLPLTLDNLQSSPTDIFLPAYYNAGFRTNITAYEPRGNSTYHGLALQFDRRFAKGLQFTSAYTWSHNIDDSTAEVFSTITTPRRPQDFQDLRADRSDSALDHRHRATVAVIYDFPYFKNRNWFLKNVVGNWEIAPIYTYETGSWGTVQSGLDSNLNGDSFGDRAIVNVAGKDGVGSDVQALTNSAGATVAYLALNPQARYITAGPGAYPNGGRNTLRFPPINNLDFTALKRFSLTERLQLEFFGQFSNALNHPQYTGGLLNDVTPAGTSIPGLSTAALTGTQVRNFLNPAQAGVFNSPDVVFPSNARTIQVGTKFSF